MADLSKLPVSLRGYVAELELQVRVMSERAAVLSSALYEARANAEESGKQFALAQEEIAKLKADARGNAS